MKHTKTVEPYEITIVNGDDGIHIKVLQSKTFTVYGIKIGSSKQFFDLLTQSECQFVEHSALRGAGTDDHLTMKIPLFGDLSYDLKDIDPPTVVEHGIRKWKKDGVLHRDDDLPAVIYPDGTELYYINGQKHREGDKPAVIFPDGTESYYKHGIEYTPESKPSVQQPVQVPVLTLDERRSCYESRSKVFQEALPHIEALPGLKSNITFWKDFFTQQSLPFPEQLTMMDYQHEFVYQNILTMKK